MNKNKPITISKRAKHAFCYHYTILTCILFATISMLSVACADYIDTNKDNNKDNVAISFDISDVQSEIINEAVKKQGNVAPNAALQTTLATKAVPTTIDKKYLVDRKLNTIATNDTRTCIIESTIAGINPVIPNSVSTRANIITKETLSDFSIMGYKGNSEENIANKPNWFYNEKADKEGNLHNTLYWSWVGDRYARFYAVYPYTNNTQTDKIKLSANNYEGKPYVTFEVEQDVTHQKDLMTACTGVVKYETQNVAPKSHLAFRHALTAIRFKVGQNLSWNKTITKVEIINALSKGTYVLSDKADGQGAKWENLSERKTFTLGTDNNKLNIKTNVAANQIIVGKDNDNYTFYMIPQQLTNNNVKACIYFSDGTKTTATLKGSWLAGTTKTYTLSERTSTWNYIFTVEQTKKMTEYNQTSTEPYTITSYRINGEKKEPVRWKVIGYDNNGDNKYSIEEKPAWFVGLSKNEDEGSVEAKQGQATLKQAEIVDHAAIDLAELQNAKSLGTASEPYDLSTCGGTTKCNTANCYIISAPGEYSLPLVYGNAIKDGETNKSAYKTSNKGKGILENFQNQIGKIDSPWIKESNDGMNKPDGAKLVWADEKGIVTDLKYVDTDKGSLQFTVPKSALKTGNAVVAVTHKGTILWSWHLWFTPKTALSTTTCYNQDNKEYRFANYPLGFRYTEWKGTPYDQPRTVNVKIQQIVANNGKKQEAVLSFSQNTFDEVRRGEHVVYQFGRKDPFPYLPYGRDLAEGEVKLGKGNNIENMNFFKMICKPNVFYTHIKKGDEEDNSITYNYCNLWSMNCKKENPTTSSETEVVKTIYDPCPVGFKVPSYHAFSMFITEENGEEDEDDEEEAYKKGWRIPVKKGDKSKTIFFPATGFIGDSDGSFYPVDDNQCCFFWTSTPEEVKDTEAYYYLMDATNFVYILSIEKRNAYAIRPIADNNQKKQVR